MSIERVIEGIKAHKRFLILSHINLEGDSIGSQAAFQILLERLSKKGVVFNEGVPPPQYAFLNVKDEIITDIKAHIDYEVIVVLDCPVVKRIGKAKKFFKKGKVVINIDHHISNDCFGDINWIEPHTSSCGEMVYKLYKALRVPIDYRTALFLYTAIVTDTGSFSYENTSSYTHTIARELIDKGLKPNLVYQALYENRSLSEVYLLKDALSTIKLSKQGRLAYMYVSKEMLRKANLDLDVTEGFINYARSIYGVKVAIIFLENPFKKGEIHISFRSKGEIDVNRLAAIFGGGGHKNASGCIVKGSLRTVMKKVITKVKQAI